MNMICRMHREGRDSEAVARHAAGREDVLWLTRDGMLVTGTNGSQLWDTAFAAQALVETGLADIEENKASTLKMLGWLDEAQIRENPKHFHTAYRQATKGAWYAAISRSSYGALNGCLEITGPSAQRNKAIRSRTVPEKLSRPFFTSKIGGSKPWFSFNCPRSRSHTCTATPQN